MATSRRSRHTRRRPAALLLALVAAMACIPQATSARSAAYADAANHSPHVTDTVTLAAQPLSFEPNRGQAEPGVGFLAHGRDYDVEVSATGASLTLGGPAARAAGIAPLPAEQTVVRVTLRGGDPAARGHGQARLPGTVGYLSGQGARPGLAAIPTFAAVRYTAVYPGVDVVYYGHEQQLEYDFQVAPGADPGRIRLAFHGVDRPTIAEDGDLILRTAGGEVRQHRPVIYQLVHGSRRSVSGGYVLTGDTVGFRVGTFDRRIPLVIDPVLVYSTYFGSKGDESANGIAVDGQGNAYIVGTTGAKAKIAFVPKIDPTGRHVLYTKFVSNIYGNARNACDSTGTGIAVDGQGNAYITGMYGYEDEFNLCNNQAVLWAKVDPRGSIVVKIFGKFSGSKGSAIAVDGQGNSYITGSTDQWELNFPVTHGAFQTKAGISKAEDGLAGDAFVLKVDPSGQVVYGTFLGGSYIDAGLGIAVDSRGLAYVVGNAGSSNFPITTNAFQQRMGNPYADGFLSILSADGSRLFYSTFLSGSNGEDLTGVAVGSHGLVYVVGSSDSRDFPTTANAYKRTCGGDGMCDINKTWYTDYSSNTDYWHINVAEDIVLAVIDPTQSGVASLRYSTFIGGRGRDLGAAIALDTRGLAYVTGRTAAADYPGAQATTGSSYDALLSVIDPRRSGADSLVFSATFGSTGDDAGQGIALDKRGNVYVAGYTNGRDFPTHNPLQAGDAGGYDAFVAKIGGFSGRS